MYRRKLLLGSGVVLSTALAGCSSDEGADDGNGNGNGNGNGGGNGGGNGNGNGGGNGNGDDDADGGDETSEPEEVDAPEPQSFSGSGATVEREISIKGGLTVVDATHTGGSSNFQVTLAGGEYDELFVNTIGEYEGASAALVEAGEYMLDVEADGNWEIEVRQPRAASGDSLPQSLEGDGPTVAGPFDFSGTHIATGSHSGEANFATHVYPGEGMFGELVFNEIGEYEGETTFSFDGVGWVDVMADGSWSIELE